MRKTSARLADGREIIYFDESDDARHETRDPRAPAPPPAASELRFDPLLEEWVIMAAHRQGRTHLPASDECPLCPSSEGRHTEIPASSYDVVAFENRFPALAFGEPPHDTTEELPVPRSVGEGRCEVLCFAADHDASFVDLSPRRVRTIVDVWADRTGALSETPGVAEVFCFENRGREIGVTLHHPHGQIYGYPFLTPRTRRTLDSARRYRERTGGDLFADDLRAERDAGTRVVRRTEHWTAFVPAAARWPVELRVYPNRRVADLPALTDAERDDFSLLYLDLLGRLDRMFDTPLPYVAAWHQAPTRTQRDLAYLHLELFSVRRAPGKLKYLAGSEAAMGVFVNDVLPETTAQRLRELAP
ncbi:galactose-1-phosphate uridylyltransferase [Halostreptopolyspora alba]|uniref:Galactose-1-phosphate uridylyltransferase n=1 Tax=Halostreptopolyspora alba TaxID=2487137 RepID=A0A3N0EFJ2_9ACTN|nr:galactose-1-phosphate uridylyltransferase [Nocardiopsaceae bacterium YIM 96095]